jgi:hypothetical protein
MGELDCALGARYCGDLVDRGDVQIAAPIHSLQAHPWRVHRQRHALESKHQRSVREQGAGCGPGLGWGAIEGTGATG